MTDALTELRLSHWRAETDADGIAWIAIDKADGSANVLSAPVLQEFDTLLEALESTQPRGVVIHSAKPGMFVMGADINEFTKIRTADEAFRLVRLGQQVLDRLEALPAPSVAVIDGFALGGGLELALACRYRVALESDKSTLGLPEVQLGIHPGFGGTVRAVRTIGIRQAMPLMLTGKSWRPAKAKALGLVDRLATDTTWRDVARGLLAAKPAPARAGVLDRLLNLGVLRGLLARRMQAEVEARANPDHYPAPYAIIRLWREHGAAGQEAYEAEARSIAELMCTETSRNLVRVFFLQNALKSAGSPDTPPVERVHVVGAGVMGGDIAAWCAYRGLEVTLQDREVRYIEPALERARTLFEKRLRAPAKVAAAMERLKPDVAGSGAADADLVIEAIFENADAKRELFAALVPAMKAGAVLASNTSSIPLEELARDLPDPGRLIGLHFFNPVAALPLVEVVRARESRREAVDGGHGFVRRIGKTPLECKSLPGFLVNRILAPYMGEAMHLARAGVPLAAIDAAAVDFGMPMGPVELADTVGLDVALHVSKILAEAFGTPVSDELQQMVDAGKLGRKSGEGFYRWNGGRPEKPDAGDATLPDDLKDRLILPMVNEAVACLADKVVADKDLLDAGVIFGTGFAPFRGGPIHYAEGRGLTEVRNRLEWLASRHGQRFLPRDGWEDLVADSTSNQRVITESEN
ncbi:MAG: 3-hydroxyacyl-CoA dehydrogenase NAD-binding domain-containing protein [Pseudomonadota bacterium]